MAASSVSGQEILREYLVALGYHVDGVTHRKFQLALSTAQLGVMGLAKGAGLAAVAVTGMVALFSRSMERLYYSSRRAESAAGNILALEYGAKQIGLTGETMRTSLEGMARALRLNPGLYGLLESLGVQVQGRDRADVLKDLIGQLKRMPFYVASQYASLFGLDPDTLLLLGEGLDKLRELDAERKKLVENAGLDYEAAARAGKEYSNMVRQVTERLSIMADIVMVKLLPIVREMTDVVLNGLDRFNSWLGRVKSFADVKETFFGKPGSSYWDFTKKAWGSLGDAFLNYGKPKVPGTQSPPPPLPAAGSPSQAQRLFQSLESMYGLPEGMLDRMWKKESGRGQSMLSPKGAQGHFQFMPSTAKEWGVSDPNDLEISATGAARYMSYLLKRYGGDVAKALGAYNWGMGNVDRLGLGSAPLETQNYIKTVGGNNITFDTKITVNGASDPKTTATLTGRAVEQAQSSALRNTVGAYR